MIDSRVFPAFPLMRKPECWAGFGGGLDSVGSDRSSSSCLQFPADSPPRDAAPHSWERLPSRGVVGFSSMWNQERLIHPK